MGKKYDPIDKNPNGFRPGTQQIVKNEREIFKLLGFPYVSPFFSYSTLADISQSHSCSPKSEIM